MLRKPMMIIFSLIGIIILVTAIINLNIVLSTKKQINKKLNKDENYDAIIILGAGVWGDSPSPMLRDRLEEGIKLYKDGVSSKILMSGDHGKESYDEVNIMKEYAIESGIPSEDVFMDHAGFSTYESIYRAKKIFKIKKAVIVTQKYHLYRSLYISNKLGLTAYGKDTNRTYSGQMYRDIREFLARDKAFINCIFKPKPTYLGKEIPITGNGNQTNDKKSYDNS